MVSLVIGFLAVAVLLSCGIQFENVDYFDERNEL